MHGFPIIISGSSLILSGSFTRLLYPITADPLKLLQVRFSVVVFYPARRALMQTQAATSTPTVARKFEELRCGILTTAVHYFIRAGSLGHLGAILQQINRYRVGSAGFTDEHTRCPYWSSGGPWQARP